MKYPRCLAKNTAFNLLELLAVVAIVGIIAAFAIPSYLNYVTQSKVNTLWHQAEAAKLAVESKYLKQNSAINSITVNSGTKDYTTPNANYVKCITIQNGVVVVRANPTNFNSKNIWIAWTPNASSGDVVWSCSYSSDAAQYVTDVGDTCAQTACVDYGAWSSAAAVGGTQTFWYFGTLTQAEVSSAFAQNCQASASMSACSTCYNFTNTNTTQRYMDFAISTATYNYQGALGSDPNWNSYSSWSYPYTYTVVAQTCKQQTRTQSTCGTTPTPYAGDPAC
jgi:type IV pilus assembly protein PilA